MPLSPLPESNTARYKLTYAVGGFEHTMTQRVKSSVTAITASDVFDNLLAFMSPTLWALTVLGMEYAVAGSDIFNPVAYSGGTSFGLGAGGPEESIRAASFTGRSSTGRKARIFLYGYKLETSGNARTTTVENGDVDNAVTYLQGLTTSFLAIDESVPVWHEYINIDHNDHWVQKIRA